MSDPAIVPLGDRALRFALSEGGDRRALLAALRAQHDIADVILTEDLGAVLPIASVSQEALRAALAAVLARSGADRDVALAPAPPFAPARVVHVVYDGADLVDIATQLGLSPDAVVALHANRDYEVAMVGFMPGFAYLRGVDPRLVLARRSTPRTRVPPGSVALAAGYTGIYPFASPGGWHLLGEALGFSPFGEDGAALGVGDRVRFEEVARPAAHGRARHKAPPTPLVVDVARRGRHLEVRKAAGLVLLVDGGRHGHMHEGVPPGGAMIPSALHRANVAAGNARGACAFEIHGALELVARGGPVTLADDAGAVHVIGDGEVLTRATERRTRVRYLAASGAIDVPLVLGARGTMLGTGLGGLEGRALRKGDVLAVGDATAAEAGDADVSPSRYAADAIRLVRGPDASDEAFRAVLAGRFTISASSDRTGTRLDTPTTPLSLQSARDHRSGPMVLGAIEQTPSGLIVLGPDHPTTGGYPIVAVVCERSLDTFHALPLGSPVVFDQRGS